ncbi:MAG: DUF6442 family protein [Clostridiales bacterium]|jgi:ABC-type maltose transport system permease subunit|nr:DUF6442 family protein [Clostridiales bacterium]
MDKNDILEKSRAAKKDEGKEHLKNLTSRYTLIPVAALAGFFVGINHSLLEEPGTLGAAIGAIIFTVAAAECFARYRFNGKKWLITGTVIAAILAVGFCVLYTAMLWR